jgi:hypothetical protein
VSGCTFIIAPKTNSFQMLAPEVGWGDGILVECFPPADSASTDCKFKSEASCSIFDAVVSTVFQGPAIEQCILYTNSGKKLS